MFSGKFIRAAGLVVAAALVVVGPATAQVLQVPSPQPPAGQFTLDTQQQPAPGEQPVPDVQLTPDIQPLPDAQPAPDTPPAPDAQPPAGTQPVPDVPQEPEPTHISNPIAVFAGLDKITGRIIDFDVYIDETVQFGALQVTPRVCYTRPLTEESRTDAFVEVDEITLNSKIQRVFTGWMFAGSPGLHAVDNAVYDVWLTDCKVKSDVPPPSKK